MLEAARMAGMAGFVSSIWETPGFILAPLGIIFRTHPEWISALNNLNGWNTENQGLKYKWE